MCKYMLFCKVVFTKNSEKSAIYTKMCKKLYFYLGVYIKKCTFAHRKQQHTTTTNKNQTQ